ncbi:MAG: FmdB family zinc ribbon protein [Pseudomonadota bacterium]|jgi:putative FmdB family regulatory protein|nr:zinc ribbon domain-containing protein [Rubrivivax sp.]MCA3258979.1 zinc ribbon domain-containing protein [Rubrivivax sp.]MCE2912930.1 zinc ribbon domain-containing protein [Rubrivivax sp.]MCZ8032093.1 zinc ribbon domain-containing protein [Rubrivivax sp.]
MPIFEYACQDCGHEFETLVRSSAHAEQPECPRCHSVQLARKLSVFATAASGAARVPALADGPPGPCGTCGHPGGPGSCALPD